MAKVLVIGVAPLLVIVTSILNQSPIPTDEGAETLTFNGLGRTVAVTEPLWAKAGAPTKEKVVNISMGRVKNFIRP